LIGDTEKTAGNAHPIGKMGSAANSLQTESGEDNVNESEQSRPPSGANTIVEKRQNDPNLLTLVELDKTMLADYLRVEDGNLEYDIAMADDMRETCPECKTNHLKLVLLQKGVKRAHMYCDKCTRCFDVIYAGETSVLA
jgi:hypothetical protein